MIALSPPEPEPALVFVGDVVLARGVAAETRRRGDPWAGWPIAAGEARIGNLEGAVAAGDCVKGEGEGFCLGFEAEQLDYARAAGFVALSLANNHSGDHGEPGLAATREALGARGIRAIEGEAPTFLEHGGRAFGLVGLDLSTGQVQARLEAALMAVATAEASADYTVVIPHWGVEYMARVHPGQRAIARTLRAWGADLVVGAGAHVVQPADCALGTWYGLGNHLMDQPLPETWTGGALRCAIGDGLRCAAQETRRTRASVFPQVGAAGEECVIPAGDAPDRAWQAHPLAGELRAVQPLPAAGEGAFFALWRRASTFDDQEGWRPYVFATAGGRMRDLWRGTALSRPIALARALPDGTVCALLRGDSFLRPDPATTERLWTAWRWKGFGFDSVDPAGCAALDPAGILARPE